MSALEPEDGPKSVPNSPLSGDIASVPARDVPEAGAAKQLTPEEQMAAFEKDLKESDWGHQPC